MPQCQSTGEIYAFMVEREVKSCVLYRFVAQSAVDVEAKALLEKMAQRGEACLEKLEKSRKSGVFENRACNLADSSFFKTISEMPASPGQSLPEILMFAIKGKHDSYLLCKEAAQQSQAADLKKLWQALAEEERRQRLELELYYLKEVINKI